MILLPDLSFKIIKMIFTLLGTIDSKMLNIISAFVEKNRRLKTWIFIPNRLVL